MSTLPSNTFMQQQQQQQQQQPNDGSAVNGQATVSTTASLGLSNSKITLPPPQYFNNRTLGGASTLPPSTATVPLNPLLNINQSALRPPPQFSNTSLKPNISLQALRPPLSSSSSQLPTQQPTAKLSAGVDSNRSTPSFTHQQFSLNQSNGHDSSAHDVDGTNGTSVASSVSSLNNSYDVQQQQQQQQQQAMQNPFLQQHQPQRRDSLPTPPVQQPQPQQTYTSPFTNQFDANSFKQPTQNPPQANPFQKMPTSVPSPFTQLPATQKLNGSLPNSTLPPVPLANSNPFQKSATPAFAPPPSAASIQQPPQFPPPQLSNTIQPPPSSNTQFQQPQSQPPMFQPPPSTGGLQQPAQFQPPSLSNTPLPPTQFQQPSQFQPPQLPSAVQPPQFQANTQFQQPPMFQPPPLSNAAQPPQFQPPPTFPSGNAPLPQQFRPPPTNLQPYTNGQQLNSNNNYPPSAPPSSQPQLSQPQQSQQFQTNPASLVNQFTNMSLNKTNQKPLIVDLLREKRLLNPYDEGEVIRPKFPHEFYTNVNCHPDIVRCTLTSIPESQNLLSKARLPLGILIHPFKDLESLKVIQSSTIVRCRNCRSYINPFVHFLDNNAKWRCNLCYSINELPDEFLFDPVTRSYGDPTKRPEINSSTIEFIAPAEYTLRPPPPAMYLFLLDVSRNAINTGYLQNACDILIECLDKLPGDGRTQIGFITYNSCLHFYNLSESLSQPQMLIYPDIEEIILPLPEHLMVNLHESRETISTFLQDLPNLFQDSYDTDSAMGSALVAAFKLLNSTGGRITVMQTCLPNVGVGALKPRNDSIDKDANVLSPQNDFYKKLALDCAGIHIAVDLFMFNALYADLATLSCISKYSGGEIKYYREFHLEHYPEQSDRFCYDFKRYLTRKIGFEAVMRIRCTRGLSIHTFHGNFFVRSTDLLSLPNVNPDAGFGMQVSIDDTLTDTATVCFQAALLYTSSKGERRIRIHTYCLPVTSNINEIINGADQEAIICLVAKMAVDRCVMNSIKEAKDAMVNVAIDYLTAFSQIATTSGRSSALISPYALRCLPLYIISLMKHIAFSYSNVKMDDRIYAMCLHKTMPVKYFMLFIYPNLYAVHNIDDTKTIVDGETEVCLPPRLHLSSEHIDRHGVYILDACESIYMWVGRSVSDQFLQQVFNVKSFNELPDHSTELPELDNVLSERIRNFIVYLYDQRPFGASFMFLREDSSKRYLFFQHIHEDKTENSLSYVEFLKYLNDQVNKN